jgi:hypothetical protein
MSNAARIAVLVAVVVIAIVGFIVLKPDDKDSSNTASTGATNTTPTHSGTGANGQGTTEEPPSPPPVANVKVGKDGKPVGGVQDLEFGQGQQVQFFVTSQVADEVHVHGYDVMKDVEPGKPAKISFKGDVSGRFEVEMEDRAEQIVELTVKP